MGQANLFVKWFTRYARLYENVIFRPLCDVAVAILPFLTIGGSLGGTRLACPPPKH